MLYNGEQVGDGRAGVRRRRRPDRRHPLTAMGMPTRSPSWRSPSAARCTTRPPSSTWTSSPPGPTAADVVDITGPVAENIRRSPRPRTARSHDVTVVHPRPPAPRPSSSGDPRGRRPDQVHHRRRRRRRDHGRPGGHRRRPADRHRWHAGGDHRRLRAQVHRRRDPGQALAERRRRAAEGDRRRPRPRPRCCPPTTWCAATTSSSSPPASPTASCSAASGTAGRRHDALAGHALESRAPSGSIESQHSL